MVLKKFNEEKLGLVRGDVVPRTGEERSDQSLAGGSCMGSRGYLWVNPRRQVALKFYAGQFYFEGNECYLLQ